MISEKINKELAYVKAKKRVYKVKKFYVHLAIYIVVNIALSSYMIIDDMNDGDTFKEAFLQYKIFAVWIYWGAGIIFQAMRLFAFNSMSKNWQKKKINELMSAENNNKLK
ncbi:2TM domain-containing protein [Polaribacter uvawellassae]|uniref:2TM domain-containing protein n=1 Tax=Polaribacter uvawellassae TaxID=3133495 RepID=UPI00321A235D